MDVTVTESGPCRRTLTIRVSPERVREHVDEVYRRAAQQVQLKGFRRGHVPRGVLEKRLGEGILSEAKMSLIDRCFRDAVREQALLPLGDPDLAGIDDAPLDVSTPFEFKVEFDVRPRIELGDLKGIEVPRGSSAVTDHDLATALQQLAEQKRTLKSVEGPVADGDFVKVDLQFKDAQGAVVVERKDARLNTNIAIAGTDPQAFAARLRGAERGQTVTVDIDFPESFEKAEVRRQKGAVEITLRDVLRVVAPPIDDALAKAFDYENLERLRDEIRQRIAAEKERANRRRQEEDVFNVLVSEHRFDLPASMVERQAQASLEDLRQRLKAAELADEEIDRRVGEAEAEARQDAERRVRLFFLLEAVADKEKIFVTENDVEVELRRIAAENNVSLDQARQYYEQQRLLPNLRFAVKERKVRDFLRESATLTD